MFVSVCDGFLGAPLFSYRHSADVAPGDERRSRGSSMQRSTALSRLGCSGEHTRRSSPAISEPSVPKPPSWVRLHSRERAKEKTTLSREIVNKKQENTERSAAAKKMRRLRLGKRLNSVFFFRSLLLERENNRAWMQCVRAARRFSSVSRPVERVA